MFQLNKDEWLFLRFQIETSKRRGGDRYLPYAFTELGVAMLSSVLNSQRAIRMNMLIMRTFVFIRQNIMTCTELVRELMDIRQRVENHDEQLNLIYEAIEKILDTKTKQERWEDRAPIGFRK